jgi:hypothetical protein
LFKARADMLKNPCNATRILFIIHMTANITVCALRQKDGRPIHMSIGSCYRPFSAYLPSLSKKSFATFG